MVKKQNDFKYMARLIAAIMIFLILAKMLIDTIILHSEFATNQIIGRIVFILIAGFIGYLLFRIKEGKKVSTSSKVFGWIITIFLILMGIFGIIFSIYSFINVDISLGFLVLIVSICLFLGGLLVLSNLLKTNRKS